MQILREASNDDSTRAVVLTGTGNFFSSGNDFSVSSMSSGQDGNPFDMTNAVTVFK